MIDPDRDRVMIAPLRSLDGSDITFLGRAEDLSGPKVVIL